ncbi:Phosphoribosylformimino-5-aminoimidazole carboxamide ribotide isomerase [Cymbomonas tetramitiformis]|uniref:1-(5-phosphoribosyl)-5-[(5-phosphoribosylamino)methylideneamino] imidazole-4-carboxamide isomerase HISN3, chloroplastic n=1 Tax=Cymbomonas tetramitiformis TaxID=36881 RepID=A0AAE0GHJ9_9CHLO|nr:Phosphoribosylformimino-5-aminoimidazole carboxamide ribotide isomerase [Cymbomonas tetramitiformis]|eukprot:gene2000-2686_t
MSPMAPLYNSGANMLRKLPLAITCQGEVAPPQRSVKFRPCIDLHKGKVKQIVGSTLSDSASPSIAALQSELVTNFETERSSAEFAEMYDRDQLYGGHVIMLSQDEETKAAAISALNAFPGGLQVGGGVNCNNAQEYLDAGASHVIVTSAVFHEGMFDEERLAELVTAVGAKRLVLDLSCRKLDGEYRVVTDRWQRFSNLAVNEETLALLAESADELLVHGVDVEGKQLGIDEELVELLGTYSSLPVTYAGGASSIADLETVKNAGRQQVDVTVGSALDCFGGHLAYTDVVGWHKAQL